MGEYAIVLGVVLASFALMAGPFGDFIQGKIFNTGTQISDNTAFDPDTSTGSILTTVNRASHLSQTGGGAEHTSIATGNTTNNTNMTTTED